MAEVVDITRSVPSGRLVLNGVRYRETASGHMNKSRLGVRYPPASWLVLSYCDCMIFPTTALSFSPDSIEWEHTNPDGTKSATLAGTREPGVMFTYAFFLPAGVWDQPHSHSADAHLHVVTGSLRLGYGDKFEPDQAGEFTSGSFLYVPAAEIHFDGAEIDTILIGTATGPWSTAYLQ